ncbi:MAG TPA: hypothetical protein VM912_06965 [Terriglobales bacterium]|nr:hypothetical protein [Terriglobales bacterium]
MNTWKGAFVAVLMSGVVVGILNGHLAIWTAVGAALGVILAAREKKRATSTRSRKSREVA